MPRNVSAQILPKTVFGEQYVNLQLPSHEKGPAIKDGDTISAGPLKEAPLKNTRRCYGDLLPLLQSREPAELNATLTAVAGGTARPWHQARPGPSCSSTRYLKQLNPHSKQLVDDLVETGPGVRRVQQRLA